MKRRTVIAGLATLLIGIPTAAYANPPTWVGFKSTGFKVTETKVVTYNGYMRHVTVSTGNRRVYDYNQRRNTTIVIPGDFFAANCLINVKIVEDWPGPYNPTSRKTFRIC